MGINNDTIYTSMKIVLKATVRRYFLLSFSNYQKDIGFVEISDLESFLRPFLGLPVVILRVI